jgi:hypothetical protein
MIDIRRADPTARRQALMIVILGALAGTLLLLAFMYYRGQRLDWLRFQLGEHVAIMLLLAAALLCVPLLALAAYLWLLGAHVIKTGVFPPPGLRVIRDTAVVTGSSAVLRGRGLKVLAVCLGAISGVFGMMLWWLARVFNETAA